jgi:hypothetical protein
MNLKNLVSLRTKKIKKNQKKSKKNQKILQYRSKPAQKCRFRYLSQYLKKAKKQKGPYKMVLFESVFD